MDQNHVIKIDKKEVAMMMTQIRKPPTLLNKSAGNSSCCIFRVPQSLVEINKEAYQPRIVSIGPYHYGNMDLEMIQQHKGRFLDDMITRTGKSLDVYLKIIGSMESRIRESYSESIDLGSNDLAKMMVLDGVFLIELFRIVGKFFPAKQDDPIFKMAWIFPFLMRDLLRMENQIPFFVLQELYEESKLPGDKVCTLQFLIQNFFNNIGDRKQNALRENANVKHLLDFVRKSYIYTNENSVSSSAPDEPNPSLKLIQPATKLVVSGVKIKVNHQANSFLDIKFQKEIGVLSIPHINMDDFYSAFFLNCMAFEQCYQHCSNDITTYLVFMGCLMRTSADMSLLTLSQNKIIENYFGTDNEIVNFFNEVGKDVAFDINTSYLKNVFVELNKYCENGWHVHWAGFKNTYFRSPWVAISAFAAFMLLCLALLQTVYTVISYYKEDN